MSSFSKAFVYLFIVGTVLGVSRPAVGQELLELARAQAVRSLAFRFKYLLRPGIMSRKRLINLLTRPLRSCRPNYLASVATLAVQGETASSRTI